MMQVVHGLSVASVSLDIDPLHTNNILPCQLVEGVLSRVFCVAFTLSKVAKTPGLT